MSSNSLIKKYIHVNDDGSQVNVPGLYIDEITKIFLARAYDKGTTRSKSLKTKSFSVARNKITGAIRDIIQREKKTKNALIEDYHLGFMLELIEQDLSASTMQIYDGSWRIHVQPFWGKKKDTDINPETYSEFLKWHKAEHGGKLFNPLKLLKALFAHIRRINPKVPQVEIYLPKKEKDSAKEPKGTYIELSEIKKILAAKRISEREKLMFRLSYNLGFRIGELTNLRKDRIKVVAGQVQIHLKAEDTKTRRARVVPLTVDLGEDLRKQMARSDGQFVFPMVSNSKKPVSKQVIDRAWIRAKEEAKIFRKMRYHDLRHTAATNFADMGVDPVKACSILGMTLTIYMGTYVKRQNLNLSSVIDKLSVDGGVK